MDVRLAFARLLLVLLSAARADVYLHNPRGSNNKLREQSNNVQNNERLFDSQNNNAGGYQVGDDCKPNCLDGNNYNVTKEGATKGVMTFYQGSELYIEWTSQHGCGVGHPNLHCQVVLQYMCDSDNPGIRDGTTQEKAGGDVDPPTQGNDTTQGQHESMAYYQACKKRPRNEGLYTADQQVRNDRGATATRQNPNGNNNANANTNRHGFECPEERDYYPYWHPTPWHDIAVLTDEPHLRCDYYREESQNVKNKGSCSLDDRNNPEACASPAGEEDEVGEWTEGGAFDEPPPVCMGGIASRDNHLGNVRNGHPVYYLWKIPDYVTGTCVLRIRYNISTSDFAVGSQANPAEDGTELTGEAADHFFVDARYNDRNPNSRRRAPFTRRTAQDPVILTNDPNGDFVGTGDLLQIQVNTNQYGRTFEDRTHTFRVRERPSDVSSSARIVNYNVRGRRGNIVQVYPAVEYDFVPNALTVEQGTYLHFQWTGSDANQQNNAGNGRAGTDRSNLVQLSHRSETVPLPFSKHTLLADMVNCPTDAGRALVQRFAYLDQRAGGFECNEEANNDGQNDNNDNDNCKQLNAASAYFDGGLVRMEVVGDHHIASTRNNDFSNRSHKATIRVTQMRLVWYAVVLLGIAAFLLLALLAYAAVAWYALTHPASWLFSKRRRPCILRLCVRRATLEHRIEQRRELLRAEREKWAALTKQGDDVEVSGRADMAQPGEAPQNVLARCLWCCLLHGYEQKHLTVIFYAGLNLVVFLIGFLSHLGEGFKSSLMYPLAKGFGFTLDLNFSMVVLPTLKTLQTAIRRVGVTREWVPIDDPISFHKAVAWFILAGSIGHIAAHVVHMRLVAMSPRMQLDPLQLWAYTAEEEASGMPWWQQLFNLQVRCAPITGILILVLMLAMFVTAKSCVRRGKCCCARRLGGYNIFWTVHMSWKWVYVLLLVHAPSRLWIWFFFPALVIAVDRLMLAQRQRLDATLKQVKLLPRDVIGLTLDVPPGFTYQAGQYILLGWRGEWHPFTLTSAPEERILSVHIRAPDSLDWCSALRKRLTVEAPAASADAAAAGWETRPKAGTVIEYKKCVDPHHQTVFCRPSLGAANSGNDCGSIPQEGRSMFGKALFGGDSTPKSDSEAKHVAEADTKSVKVHFAHGQTESFASQVPEDKLPDDAVVMQLTGPFGAPAQKVWQFDTLMVVGAGIGVTPFASILRSVQLRAKQRQAILGAALRPSKWRSAVSEGVGSGAGCGVRDSEGLEKLLEDAVSVPKRIYFYWIVRSQEEFDWFYDLLVAATEGPAQGIVNITVFMTGEVELSEVRKLPCASGQFFGRPNWGRIFKQNRKEHAGEHVGVFLCGSSAIGTELAHQSVKHTDPPGQPGGTRFSFFKEHF